MKSVGKTAHSFLLRYQTTSNSHVFGAVIVTGNGQYESLPGLAGKRRAARSGCKPSNQS